MPEAVDAVIAAARDFLGERITTNATLREHHSHGQDTQPPVLPDAVAFIETADEAARMLALCNSAHVPVVAWGAGTSLEGHVTPVRGGITLDLSRMTRIIAVSQPDMDCRIEAGVTRDQLNEHLRDQGMFFPVDPGTALCTIGGMCATRASGTNAVRYGTIRENVLGLTVALADGRVIHTGGRVRKSATGYDLTRLFIGSEGTLGLIVEATLRVHPTPEAMYAAVLSFPTMQDAVDTVTEVAQYGIPVARIELADELTIDMINKHFEFDMPLTPTLFLEFHGGEAEVAAQAESVREIAESHALQGYEAAADETERRRLWRARHGAYEATKATQPGCEVLTTDVCVPVSELAASVLEAQADIAEHRLKAAIVGHVGDGNFHVAVVLDPERPEELVAAEEFHDRVVRRALARGGTCTGEHGVGYGKSRFLVEEHGDAAVGLMRTIKEALDPHDLFNPGKGAQAA